MNESVTHNGQLIGRSLPCHCAANRLSFNLFCFLFFVFCFLFFVFCLSPSFLPSIRFCDNSAGKNLSCFMVTAAQILHLDLSRVSESGVVFSKIAKMTEIFCYTAFRQLLQMVFAIIFFHLSEYILAIGTHGKSEVTPKSLLISSSYLLAMGCSFIEYVIEIYFFPGLKEYWWISNTGLAMVIFGEIIRKLAILTAGQAFTHVIRIQHEENHRLVTHGIYRYIRHPSYCGFFIWSVGTQIMLCNPMATIAFVAVVWRFFSQRIPYEEYFLRRFFGSQYDDYASRVPSGVPFVR